MSHHPATPWGPVRTQTCHLLTELHRHKVPQDAVPDASLVGFRQWHCKLVRAPVSLAVKQSVVQRICVPRVCNAHPERPQKALLVSAGPRSGG